MATKLLTEIEDSDEEVTAPAGQAVTEKPELKREPYPSEQNQTIVSGAVDNETCQALDQWIAAQPFKLSRNRVIKTLIELFIVDEYMQIKVHDKLAPDELEQILADYTPFERAKLAAFLRGNRPS